MVEQRNVGAESRKARRQRGAQLTPEELQRAVKTDRFEEVQKGSRVGAHRAIGRPRRFWIYLVSALVATVLLTVAGIIAVQVTGARLDGNSDSGAHENQAAPSVQATLDPEASVVVLNGTEASEFEAVVDGLVTENNWGKILLSAPAATSNVEKSVVFYSADSDEAAARGLANQLSIKSVAQTQDYDQYEGRLTVLIGADYQGPGADQMHASESHE